MDQRFVLVLFLAVMGLVVVTCGGELAHLWRGADKDWAGVFGSWFGGVASFAAVVAALGIAGWQKQSQDWTIERANLKIEKIVLHRVNRQCTLLAMRLGLLLQDDTTLFINAHLMRDERNLHRSFFMPDGLNVPILPLGELVYIDTISLRMVDIYDRLEIHRRNVEIMGETNDDDVFSHVVEGMKVNLLKLREHAVEVSLYARARLGVINRSLDAASSRSN